MLFNLSYKYNQVYTVESLSNEHIGTEHFVHYREVVLFWRLQQYKLVLQKLSFILRYLPLSNEGEAISRIYIPSRSSPPTTLDTMVATKCQKKRLVSLGKYMYSGTSDKGHSE